MDLNHLSSSIIGAAIEVHEELGPGLLESVYRDCMLVECERSGLKAESEVPVAVLYRGRTIHLEGFRIDLLIESTVIVELKSVEKVRDVHKKQLLTYVRLARKPGYIRNSQRVKRCFDHVSSGV
jgi:GxxExxY protein